VCVCIWGLLSSLIYDSAFIYKRYVCCLSTHVLVTWCVWLERDVCTDASLRFVRAISSWREICGWKAQPGACSRTSVWVSMNMYSVYLRVCSVPSCAPVCIHSMCVLSDVVSNVETCRRRSVERACRIIAATVTGRAASVRVPSVGKQCVCMCVCVCVCYAILSSNKYFPSRLSSDGGRLPDVFISYHTHTHTHPGKEMERCLQGASVLDHLGISFT